ncbi:MAG: nitroreductase family protein [Acidimicrobiia bacterium]
MDVFEALYTTRAMRRVKPDPVPDEVVRAMLDAAIRSPSGGNSQNWRWLTVTDKQTIVQLAELYADAWQMALDVMYQGKLDAAEASGDQQTVRVISSAQWLADNFDQVPLVVLPFHRNDPSGSSIYPAVWSLMLAARAHDIGATLTTVLGIFKQEEVCDLLGVPTEKGWVNAAAVTCGYPLGRWGVAKRAPANDVVFEERWGDEPDWSIEEPLWGSPAAP